MPDIQYMDTFTRLTEQFLACLTFAPAGYCEVSSGWVCEERFHSADMYRRIGATSDCAIYQLLPKESAPGSTQSGARAPQAQSGC